MHKIFSVFPIFLFAISYSPASVAQAQNPIPKFSQVSSGIYRGARPLTEGLRTLQKLGVRTIINLDDDLEAIGIENREARQFNIRMVALPMSAYWFPEDEKVNRILRELDNKDNYPIFVHCQYGEDRTGLIVGLYRVEYQNWEPQYAYGEMLKMGFHKILWPLNHYFEERTGLD